MRVPLINAFFKMWKAFFKLLKTISLNQLSPKVIPEPRAGKKKKQKGIKFNDLVNQGTKNCNSVIVCIASVELQENTCPEIAFLKNYREVGEQEGKKNGEGRLQMVKQRTGTHRCKIQPPLSRLSRRLLRIFR